MQQLEINASNIKCGGCVNNIKNGLAELAGVHSVEVDIPSNRVTVQGDALDPGQIRDKLAALGYPAVD